MNRSIPMITDTNPAHTTPERLDLELYLDRLVRHEQRLCDEVCPARMRIVWTKLERELADERTSVEETHFIFHRLMRAAHSTHRRHVSGRA